MSLKDDQLTKCEQTVNISRERLGAEYNLKQSRADLYITDQI